MRKGICSVEDCDRPRDCHGVCTTHLYRLNRYGSLELPRKPTAVERFWSKVDKSEDCWLWTGTQNRKGYGHFNDGGRTVRAHKFSYQLRYGDVPDGLVIDHICRCRHCVNPAHLRAVTQKQNLENLSGPQSNNTSGVLGVCWSKAAKKWLAQVKHNRRYYYVGVFEKLEDAEAAVIAKRLELFTHNEKDRAEAA